MGRARDDAISLPESQERILGRGQAVGDGNQLLVREVGPVTRLGGIAGTIAHFQKLHAAVAYLRRQDGVLHDDADGGHPGLIVHLDLQSPIAIVLDDPCESDVGIVALTLDPSVQLGSAPTADCPAPPFCITPGGLAGIQDLPRLKPTITNTFEVGYKGLLGDRVLLGLNGWWSHISDFTSALRIASPNVFLNGQEIGVYLATQFLPLVGIAFPDAATALATAAQLAATMGGVPLGVVTPGSVGGTDATLAFVYENLGSLDVFGAEASVQFLLSDEWELATTLSVVDKDKFETTARGVSERVPLNAPTLKGTAALSYRSEGGFNGQVRFRAQNGFDANSAVYIGRVDPFAVLDVGLGYKLPGLEGVWLQVDVQNVFDNQHQTFVGTPLLGRLALARIRYDFSPF